MTTAKLTLEEWLSERCGNAMAIAAGETGAERDWWLEEIEYFKQAVEALEEVSKLREALKRVEDALMVNSVQWRAMSEALKIAKEALGK